MTAVICPSVTAADPHEFREQIEKVAAFAERIHLDFMDGDFAPTVSLDIEQAWWPVGVQADLHIMYQHPEKHLARILQLKPSLVIVHAEAQGNFSALAQALHQAGISVGVALLQETAVEVIRPGIADIDHVLIFSGDLGRFGGQADLQLLQKVEELRELRSTLEIGWDGGINSDTIGSLVSGGIDVLNVGGFIQKSDDSRASYATLKALVEQQR